MSGILAAFAKASPGLRLACGLYLLALLASAASLALPARRNPKDRLGLAAFLLFAGAWLANVLVIVARGLEAGRLPFRTAFESLLAFAALLGLLGLASGRLRRMRLLGGVVLLLILGALGAALGRADVDVAELPPALRSAWFLPHVTAYFAGYACVTVAALFSALALLRPSLQAVAEGSFWHRAFGSTALDLPALARSWTRGGFLLLSAGLFTGALWAVFAWSDYWSWDPKEGWGLATWLVYAAVLHLHHARERSTRLALAAGLLGWGLVAFTFFGMQLLPTRAQSLHVYEAPPGR